MFDVDDVAVLDEDEDRLEASLHEAVGSGLLTIDDGRYAFDHSLTQQALYAGLQHARNPAPAHRGQARAPSPRRTAAPLGRDRAPSGSGRAGRSRHSPRPARGVRSQQASTRRTRRSASMDTRSTSRRRSATRWRRRPHWSERVRSSSRLPGTTTRSTTSSRRPTATGESRRSRPTAGGRGDGSRRHCTDVAKARPPRSGSTRSSPSSRRPGQTIRPPAELPLWRPA